MVSREIAATGVQPLAEVAALMAKLSFRNRSSSTVTVWCEMYCDEISVPAGSVLTFTYDGEELPELEVTDLLNTRATCSATWM